LPDDHPRVAAIVDDGVVGVSFECVTEIRAPAARVFDLALSIDAHLASMRDSDEQVSGPFRRFRHEHRFATTGASTQMVDRVSFDAPLGLVGRAVERLVLGDYLRKLITQRNEFLKAAAETTGD
jgi:hypothetical protein